MRGPEDVIHSPVRDTVAASHPTPAGDPSAVAQIRTGRAARRDGAALLRRLAVVALGMLATFGTPTRATAQDQNPGGIQLTPEGDQITLAVNETTGVPVKDFIKLAGRITGKSFSVNDTEFTAPGLNVNFIGPYKIKKDEFYNFFQTMLYIRGFACVPRRTGSNEIVEIISFAGTRRTEISAAARYVAFEDLEQYSSQTGVQILTTIPVKYLNATNAVTQTRPFFNAQPAAGGTPLIIGALGDNRTVLLQGFGPQVWAAYQVLKLSDVPPVAPDEETRVVKLYSATAEELELVL